MFKFIKRATCIVLTGAMILSSLAVSGTADAKVKAKKIVLNKKAVTLTVGDTFKVKVKKVNPSKAGKAVTYKTSKKAVATVSKSGVIKAVSAGKAVVTVTSKTNKKAKAKVNVTVNPANDAQVTKAPDIQIVPTNKPLSEGIVVITAAPSTEIPTKGPKPTATPTPAPTTVPDPAAGMERLTRVDAPEDGQYYMIGMNYGTSFSEVGSFEKCNEPMWPMVVMRETNTTTLSEKVIFQKNEIAGDRSFVDVKNTLTNVMWKCEVVGDYFTLKNAKTGQYISIVNSNDTAVRYTDTNTDDSNKLKIGKTKINYDMSNKVEYTQSEYTYIQSKAIEANKYRLRYTTSGAHFRTSNDVNVTSVYFYKAPASFKLNAPTVQATATPLPTAVPTPKAGMERLTRTTTLQDGKYYMIGMNYGTSFSEVGSYSQCNEPLWPMVVLRDTNSKTLGEKVIFQTSEIAGDRSFVDVQSNMNYVLFKCEVVGNYFTLKNAKTGQYISIVNTNDTSIQYTNTNTADSNLLKTGKSTINYDMSNAVEYTQSEYTYIQSKAIEANNYRLRYSTSGAEFRTSNDVNVTAVYFYEAPASFDVSGNSVPEGFDRLVKTSTLSNNDTILIGMNYGTKFSEVGSYEQCNEPLWPMIVLDNINSTTVSEKTIYKNADMPEDRSYVDLASEKTNLLWKVEVVGDYYTFKNISTGKYLSVINSNDTKIEYTDTNTADSNKFKIGKSTINYDMNNSVEYTQFEYMYLQSKACEANNYRLRYSTSKAEFRTSNDVNVTAVYFYKLNAK